MKWYGSNNFLKKTSLINKNKKIKNYFKNNFFVFKNNTNLNFYKINFYLPDIWNFILIKKSLTTEILYFYIYSNEYFFILPFLKKFSFFKYDFLTNSLIFNFIFKNNFFGLFWNFFKIIFFSFSRIFFKKLKFKGKGYYIYKNVRNTVALQFGYSHLYYLYSFFVTVKFLTKTSVLIFGINYKDLIRSGNNLYNIKKINIFTGKGIRFSRQIIYRKTGKISSYR